MKETNYFYDRPHWPYLKDKQMTAAYAVFFKSVKWQLICTFTFGSRPSDEIANWKFNQFINRLEATIKADVIYLRGDEKRFSGCGKPACGRHFHVVMTSAAPMHSAYVAWLWKDVAGSWDDGAYVQPYDPKLDGVKYILKMMNQPYGDWTARKLHLVFPVGAEMLDKRIRRQLRRHEARMKEFASMKTPAKLMPSGPEPVVHVSPLSGCFGKLPY